MTEPRGGSLRPHMNLVWSEIELGGWRTPCKVVGCNIFVRGHVPRMLSLGDDERMGEIDGRRCRVLVVDDDEAIRETVAEILRIAGYHTDVAADAEETLSQVDKGDVGLLLLDLGVDFSVAKLLEEIAEPPPVIFMSGSQDRRGRRRGPLFLSKPFPPQQLLNEVARHLKPVKG